MQLKNSNSIADAFVCSMDGDSEFEGGPKSQNSAFQKVSNKSASSSSFCGGSSEQEHRVGDLALCYDSDVLELTLRFLKERNHQGLALLARQKGLPPFLRFKIWPIILKHHPFVLNPFIMPDDDVSGKSKDLDADLALEVQKDLQKYVHRLSYINDKDKSSYSDTEYQFFKILEHSVLKFVNKWGRIIKYDQALTWIALGLAEWFPPIPHTTIVLLGRDSKSDKNTFTKDLFEEYENYIGRYSGLNEYLEELKSDNEMTFQDVYERLVLVLLHTPEEKAKFGVPKSLNKKSLPLNGGIIEERVSFFMYCLRKLLPELSQYFQEEKMLNKFGSHDDEWLIWWLKWCGSKVWSRIDRGRIWDLLFGWRLENPKKSKIYYLEKLDIDTKTLEKLGPDIFWSVGEGNDDQSSFSKNSSSFKDLMNELNSIESLASNSPCSESPNTIHATESSRLSRSSQSSFERPSTQQYYIPFSTLDPHIELIFITLALLKSKESLLFELDQHEIRQFLSRLPTNSVSINSKYKHLKPDSSQSSTKSNDLQASHSIDYMENILIESGELWRKWLWQEMICDD